MTRARKIILIIINLFLIWMVQVVTAAKENTEYIVKIRSDVCLLSMQEENPKPLIPKLGLYTVSDISDIDPDLIEFAEKDAEVELFDTYNYDSIMKQQEYIITGIKSMWDIGVYGKGVRVGVIDSGCNSHQALHGNLCAGANFADDSNDTNDNIGHGTAVSGIIAAEYGQSNLIGAAHKAGIVPLKFIDRDGEGNIIGGTTKRLASAIISAVDDFNCDIINMSCGTIDSNTLKLAVDYAVSNGVIVVAAVGNSGDSAYNYPAAYDSVIGVGSVNNLKEHSSFSNINSSVFVTAPGENINILSGIDSSRRNSGTSFSAPYVSGIIGNMLEIKPELTAHEIITLISETAEDLGDGGYDEVFGYGLIRADRIIDYILRECQCFVSAIDLCTEDNFNEIRFRFSGVECPKCIFAEYTDGMLSRINLETQHIDNDIFMIRLPHTDTGLVKCFVWNSIESMMPLDINIGI